MNGQADLKGYLNNVRSVEALTGINLSGKAQKDGFEKGKTDAKSNLTVDDIPPKLVGEWIRVMRQKEGK